MPDRCVEQKGGSKKSLCRVPVLTVVLITTMVLWSQFLALGSAGGMPATCVPATCGASRSRKTCLCPGTGALGYPATCVEQKDWVLKQNSLEAGRGGIGGEIC